MHAQFLRACFLRNTLVEPGVLTVDGTAVDVSRIETPLYVLGAESDHIAPWRSSYRTTQLVAGDARFTLSSGGHAASMVNPPGNPKARYRSRTDCPADPETWLKARARCGQLVGGLGCLGVGAVGRTRLAAGASAGEPAPGRYARG